jgi:hypothetical protein
MWQKLKWAHVGFQKGHGGKDYVKRNDENSVTESGKRIWHTVEGADWGAATWMR